MAKQRLIYLDIIRGLAALSVFFTHWVLWTSLPGDTKTIFNNFISLVFTIFKSTLWAWAGLHPGVAVFIVLSGFCIHLPIAIKRDSIGTKGYWLNYAYRRLMRIAPIYWLGLALGVFSVGFVYFHPGFRPYFMSDSLKNLKGII